MDRTERISRYEEILNRTEEAIRRFEAARQECVELQEAAAQLERYYTSAEWKEDFEADEAGLLPADLKRGVLSEDGIDRVLEWFREFRDKAQMM